jgi:site-specific DNA-methyltransferase (adenine-specific)
MELLPAFVGTPELNNVYHCDALTLLGAMGSGSVNCVLIDPPYNMTELDFETTFDWGAFWVQARRILVSPNCPTIIFSQQPFTTDLINTNRKAYRNEIIYEKAMPTGFLNANRRPLQAHENIILFSDKAPDYFPQMEESGIARHPTKHGYVADHYQAHEKTPWQDNGKRYPRSVWKFAQRNNAFHSTKTLHPTEKPLPLMERLIGTYTRAGDVVLDCFAGSGSTLLAARNCGRNFIGCELDSLYVEGIRKRLAENYTLPMFLEATS